MASKEEVAQNLLSAMDLLNSKRLGDLSFDKTLICSIEDNTNAARGEYTVTDGSSTFLAYTDDEDLAVGQQVYVKVPNGDMSYQKIIVGKYITVEGQSYKYISPLNDFVDITQNIVDANIEDGLIANGPASTKLLWQWSSTSDGYISYQRIGLRSSFITDFKDKTVISGEYGLRLTVGDKKSNKVIYYNYYLNTEDMYGNPYSSDAFLVQEKAFDISNCENIVSLSLSLYQMNNFFDDEGQKISAASFNDILCSNVYLSFGYDKEIISVGDNTIIFGNTGSNTYQVGETNSTRKIYLRWIRKDDIDTFVIDEKSEMPKNSVIHWYQYKSKSTVSDTLAGNFWEEITPSEDLFNHIFSIDYGLPRDKYKVIIEDNSREYILKCFNDDEDYVVAFNDLISAAEEKDNKIGSAATVQAKTLKNNLLKDFDFVYNEEDYSLIKDLDATKELINLINSKKAENELYYSKELVFENNVASEEVALDLITGLTITCDASGYNGVFNIYKESNEIMSEAEASKVRYLRAVYQSDITDESYLSMAEQISWYFPKNETMIQAPEEGVEYLANTDYFDDISDDDYYIITRNGVELGGEDFDALKLSGEQLIQDFQKFRIKNYYTQVAKNNTIRCVVRKNNRDYAASYSMSFGPSGSNGTNATFILSLTDTDGNLIYVLNEGQEAVVKAELFDYNNKPMALTDLQFSFYNEEESTGITLDQGTGLIKFNANASPSNPIVEARVKYVIEAEEQEDGTIKSSSSKTLVAYLPLGLCLNNSINLKAYEGASKIVYNNMGSNPDYYKNQFHLLDNNDNIIQKVSWRGMGKTPEKYYPTIGEEGYIFPVAMYCEGLDTFGVDAYIDGKKVFHQAILITIDKYSSSLLNSWDKGLALDNENGTILSSMVAAGKKNSDNTYTGVVMGDVRLVDQSLNKVGLYGIHKGAFSFGFTEDGSGFIGKSGHGRLLFDGDSSIITSSGYKADGDGMLIDFDDGVLRANRKGIGSIKIDANSTNASSLFNITASDDNGSITLMNVGTSSYYLQSANYATSTEEEVTGGMRINLSTGNLTAVKGTNRITINSSSENSLFSVSGGGSSLINIGTGSYYLRSAGYGAEGTSGGTFFNLSSGYFNSYGAGGSVIISPGSSSRVFSISAKDEQTDETTGEDKTITKEIMRVGKDYYYLRSFNFNDTENPRGMNLNLSTGTFQSKNSGGTVYINPESETRLFSIETNNDDNKEANFYLGKNSFRLYSRHSVDDEVCYTSLDLYNGVSTFKQYNNSITISPGRDYSLFSIDVDGASIMNVGANSYYLRSASYAKSNEGLNINLIDGSIRASGGSIGKNGKSGSSIIIDSTPTTGMPYFQIKDTDGNILIKITDSAFVMKPSTDEGLTIDLSSGKIEGAKDGKKFTINLKDESTPLNVNNTFKVNWDGTISAQGSITATSGKVGGWIISENALATSGIYLVSKTTIQNKNNTVKEVSLIGAMNASGTTIEDQITSLANNLGDSYNIQTNDFTIEDGIQVSDSDQLNTNRIGADKILDELSDKNFFAVSSEGRLFSSAAIFKTAIIGTAYITEFFRFNGYLVSWKKATLKNANGGKITLTYLGEYKQS